MACEHIFEVIAVPLALKRVVVLPTQPSFHYTCVTMDVCLFFWSSVQSLVKYYLKLFRNIQTKHALALFSKAWLQTSTTKGKMADDLSTGEWFYRGFDWLFRFVRCEEKPELLQHAGYSIICIPLFCCCCCCFVIKQIATVQLEITNSTLDASNQGVLQQLLLPFKTSVIL